MKRYRTESVGSFVRKSYFRLGITPKQNLQRGSKSTAKSTTIGSTADVQYAVGDLVLLSTRNLKMKGILGKLKKRFMGPFKIQKQNWATSIQVAATRDMEDPHGLPYFLTRRSGML